MASSSTSANLALACRNLRAPPSSSTTSGLKMTSNLKLSSALTPPMGTGPSYVSLFLTNLRLLDLDTRRDWPGITAPVLGSASKDAKKRIQCVEWALYQLFVIWDSEEARNKLQPFFPPLEPLQSLNLRTALYRCLDQAKKTGVLGRDTVLRKTMLDECKGERLEEVLAVFSNVVLEKVVQIANQGQHTAIAQSLALENFSYSGERTILSSLILAHKALLSKHIRDKNTSRAKYHDFSELLDLNHRRATRRKEQLKELAEQNNSKVDLSKREVLELHERFRRNWSGNSEWTESILYGDCNENKDELLSSNFEDIWKHVESSTIGDLEIKQQVGLLEQLDARVKGQAARLAKWQDFSKTLAKKEESPVKKSRPQSQAPKIFGFSFDRHQMFQVRTKPVEVSEAAPLQEDYQRILDNMKTELENVGKPKPQPDNRKEPESPVEDESIFLEDKAIFLEDKSLSSETRQHPKPSPPGSTHVSATKEETWSAASSESDDPSPEYRATMSTSRTPPSEAATDRTRLTIPLSSDKNFLPTSESEVTSDSDSESEEDTIQVVSTPRKIPPKEAAALPIRISPKSIPALDPEADFMADEILQSMAGASPSPKKPRHTLSLAERTKLSMARSSHSQYSDLHDDPIVESMHQLSLRPKVSSPLPTPDGTDPHADLIERTRRSMAGFEAAQKKAKLERRRSIKAATKRQQESSYFPKIDDPIMEDLDPSVLLEGDPDYDSVFKSRPKIKTSPAVSPSRSLMGLNEEK